MNSTAKSFVAAGAILGGTAAVLGGHWVRAGIDRGEARGASIADLSRSNLVASKTTDVPEDFFREMVRLLKKEYVDPITDDQKLASGAVRGMINSLNDPHSQFMGSQEFKTYLQMRQGEYEGIGAAFTLHFDPPPKPSGSNATPPPVIPKLMVASVVPGSAAETAGLRPGDWIEWVDDHWVMNAKIYEEYEAAQKKAEKNEITGDELRDLRNSLRERLDRSYTFLQAHERLTQGREGSVTLQYVRNDRATEATLQKGFWKLPLFDLQGSRIQSLIFTEGTAESMRRAIGRHSELTIDLRNNPLGDFESMRQTLAVLAPAGTYGTFHTDRRGTPQTLSIEKGNPHPPKLTLIVDETTRGVAEIFALALSSKGLAQLEGGPMAGDLTRSRIVQLPDGSGYTLAVGTYRPEEKR